MTTTYRSRGSTRRASATTAFASWGPVPPGTRVDAFMANPVLCAEHDVGTSLARISDLRADDAGIQFHSVFDASSERAMQVSRHVNAGLTKWCEALVDESGRLLEVSLTCAPRSRELPDELHADVAESTTCLDSNGCVCSTANRCTCFRPDTSTRASS